MLRSNAGLVGLSLNSVGSSRGLDGHIFRGPRGPSDASTRSVGSNDDAASNLRAVAMAVRWRPGRLAYLPLARYLSAMKIEPGEFDQNIDEELAKADQLIADGKPSEACAELLGALLIELRGLRNDIRLGRNP